MPLFFHKNNSILISLSISLYILFKCPFNMSFKSSFKSSFTCPFLSSLKMSLYMSFILSFKVFRCSIFVCYFVVCFLFFDVRLLCIDDFLIHNLNFEQQVVFRASNPSKKMRLDALLLLAAGKLKSEQTTPCS